MDMILDIPYSSGRDSFVEPGVNAHLRGSRLLHGKLLDFFECPRCTLFETHSMDALVNVDGVFSRTTTLMVDQPFFFSPPFFAGAILQGRGWKETLFS